MSDELIDRLSAGLRPVSRLVVLARLAVGLGAGAAVSAALTVATLGLRPDLAQAVGEAMFWVKLAYTVALAGLSVWAIERLARPASSAHGRLGWLFAPVLGLTALAGWQLTRTPAALRGAMMMGHSADVCPWCIVAFALPPLIGLVWAVRGLAPTRLRLTGALVGLAAGAAGASAYALHCDEFTAAFMVVWYSLGICVAGLVGGLLGPRLLRW